MIIYKTVCLINGKIYVGKDARNLPHYLGSGKIFVQALKKYGRENFKKEILELCETEEQLFQREKFWIKELNATNPEIGYNLSTGGDGATLYGDNHPKFLRFAIEDEDRIIEMYSDGMSLSAIGKEFRISKSKVSSILISRGVQKRTRSEIASKRTHSIETRKKMSESRRGEKNGMYNKSLYDRWVEKYGTEEAEKLKIAYSTKMTSELKKIHAIKKELGIDWGFAKNKL